MVESSTPLISLLIQAKELSLYKGLMDVASNGMEIVLYIKGTRLWDEVKRSQNSCESTH